MHRRWNEVFWTGLKIDSGFIFQHWILNLGYFFTVEIWDRESLKIHVYPGSFFQQLCMYFSSKFCDDPDTLNIDPVEFWPQTKEFWILLIHCVTSKYFGGDHKQQGGAMSLCINWSGSRQKCKYIFYDYNKLFLIRYNPPNPAKHPLFSSTAEFCKFFCVPKHSKIVSFPMNFHILRSKFFFSNPFIAMTFPFC